MAAGQPTLSQAVERADQKVRHTLGAVSTDVDCQDVLSLLEFEELARQSMTPMAYEFVASGAADEHTLRWNREAFDRIRLRPRVLRDVATVDMRVTLLGTAVGPSAFAVLVLIGKERALARLERVAARLDAGAFSPAAGG